MRHEIIPSLRYADALTAISFLCDAFRFERKVIHVSQVDATLVDHAQLVWADQMIMVNSISNSDHALVANMKTVIEAGGPTIGLYLIVEDVDAHAAHARAAGAEIIEEPNDKDYGGRGYTARDTEGNIWSFGSYDPWAD